MKKHLILLLLAPLLCSGCGLWAEHPPLEAVEAVETLGVDLSDRTRVSVTTGSGEDAERIDETGDTLPLALDALRDRSLHGGLFYGHTQYLLLGEDFARAGVQPLLDYTARSAELRLSAPVYLLRGQAADAVLAETLDVTGQLTALSRSGWSSCTALELSDALAQSGCAMVCAVRYDREADALRPDGYAILLQGTLAGYLDGTAAQAGIWLRGSDSVTLALDSGASFTLSRRALYLDADWSDGIPTAITLSLEADAAAQTLPEGTQISQASTRAALEAALAEAVAARLATAISQTQSAQADALGLGAMLAGAHPFRWRHCAARWETLYPTLPITVRAAVRITDTQDLTDPLPEEGGV